MEESTTTVVIAKLLKLISVGRFNMDSQGAVFMAETLRDAEALIAAPTYVPPALDVQDYKGDTNVE